MNTRRKTSSGSGQDDPFRVIEIISCLMPHAIEVAWQRMREQVTRERRHCQALLERHRRAPSSETLSSLRAILEKNRESAQSAIENRNELARMVSSQKAICGQLDQKARKAAKRGDKDLAANLQQEHDSYEQSLTVAIAGLEQAEATLTAVQQALARAEDQLRREEERIQNAEDKDSKQASEVKRAFRKHR